MPPYRNSDWPSLHAREQRLLIGLLRVEQGEIVDIAELRRWRVISRLRSAARSDGDRLLQGDRVVLRSRCRFGDVLERGDHRAAILRRRPGRTWLARRAPLQQRAAVEDRLGDAPACSRSRFPARTIWRARARAAGIAVSVMLGSRLRLRRRSARSPNADSLRRRGCPDAAPPVSRQAERQIARQAQCGKLEFLGRSSLGSRR